MVMLSPFVEKLQRGISFLPSRKPDSNHEKSDEEPDVTTIVPNDVKEGHFAVVAVEGDESMRFIVELSCLSNPAFMSLLRQAEEEYGFQQKGALLVPCRPEELQKILKDRRKQECW